MTIAMKIRKVTVLPTSFEPSTLYLLTGAEAGLMDLYVSTSDGSAVRHIITKSEITTMISEALSGFSTVQVVADITARDALNPTVAMQVLVLDATADPTVISGAATYVYNPATDAWYKISEAESMDVVLDWDNIVGKPTSAPADIDDAVTKRHTHANKATLDLISDQGGALGYNGVPVRAYLEEEAW